MAATGAAWAGAGAAAAALLGFFPIIGLMGGAAAGFFGVPLAAGALAAIAAAWALGELAAPIGGSLYDAALGAAAAFFGSHPITPLVIDLDHDGAELTTLAASKAYFDLDGDGYGERTAWVAADDGLLARDIDGDGKIDDINELFGGSQSGFTKLRALDSNTDNFISASDAAFGELLVWRDLNQDGTSSSNELSTLSQTGITSINLAAAAVSQVRAGNQVTEISSVSWSNGSTSEIIDVLFQNDQTDAVFNLPQGFTYSDVVYDLPNIRGFGETPDLWIAMTLDPSLLAAVQSLAVDYEGLDVATFRQRVEAVLFAWTGADEVSSGSRGQYVDAQHLFALEALTGVDFRNYLNSPNPSNANQGSNVETYYTKTFDALVSRFIVQLASADLNSFVAERAAAATAGFAAGTDNLESLIDRYLSGDVEVSLDDISSATSDLFTSTQSVSFDLSGAPKFAFLGALGYNPFSDTIIGDWSKVADNLAGQLSTSESAAATELSQLAPYAHALAATGGMDVNAFDANLLAGMRLKGVYGAGFIEGNALLSLGRNVVIGTLGNDVFTGGSLSSIWSGGAGNDTIAGSSVNDILFGGDGTDTLNASYGDDWLDGGAGADTLDGGPNNDVLVGGLGNDTLRGGTGVDTFHFSLGDGADTIATSGETDKIVLGTGLFASSVVVSKGPSINDLSITFIGNSVDQIVVKDQFYVTDTYGVGSIVFADGTIWTRADIRAIYLDQKTTDGDDNVSGFDMTGDIIDGGLGNDWIDGRNGADTLYGGAGADTIYGQWGNDVLYGGDGNDYLDGGYDNDILIGGRGNDTLRASGGADDFQFNPGDGADLIASGGAACRLVLGAGFSLSELRVARVSSGDDVVLTFASHPGDQVTISSQFYSVNYGVNSIVFADGSILSREDLKALYLDQNTTDGADLVYGFNSSGDVIDAGAGNDFVDGRDGNDTLYGGYGNDILIGGAGNDSLRGYSGVDIFEFALGAGADTVYDFASGDKVRFGGFGYDDPSDVMSHATQQGSNVVFSDQGVSILFSNLTIATFAQTDFLFSPG
jgi:Ca2+-binding RTX toxin-like protein